MFLINSPLIFSGFSFFKKSIKKLKFSSNFSDEKLFRPIEQPTLPSLSFFNSTKPVLMSATAFLYHLKQFQV